MADTDTVIATGPCQYNGVLAANTGARIPREHAEKYGWPFRELDDNGAPAGNASRDEWATFALTQGATDADLEGLTRDELRDKYGA